MNRMKRLNIRYKEINDGSLFPLSTKSNVA